VAASKVANAFDFVSRLPAGFETEITNAQLSGGQKQRKSLLPDSNIV
jgi:ABC-type protease/lipase transport system fused ATPase/permease subunit